MHRFRTAFLALGVGVALIAPTAIVSLSADSASGALHAAHERKKKAKKKKQRGAIEVLPQIAAPGKRPQSASAAKSVVVASFKPVVRSSTVTIQRKKGKRWVTAARAKQSSKSMTFAVPYAAKGKPVTYRAMSSGKGVKKTVTKTVRTDLYGAADYTEEFGGRKLPAGWHTRHQGYTDQRECAKADDKAVKVGGGTVRLSAIKDKSRTGTCSYTLPSGKKGKSDYLLNGHIATINDDGTPDKTFLYGYMAARVKFQRLRGQHASFWMQSTLGGVGNARTTGAEVDVIEYFGDKHPAGGLSSFVYSQGKQFGGMLKKPQRFGGSWSKRFHVFSVEWTPTRYVFRIDGQVTSVLRKGVSRVPEFMVLSLLSSDWELPLLKSSKQLPQTMQVDWVRHWQL